MRAGVGLLLLLLALLPAVQAQSLLPLLGDLSKLTQKAVPTPATTPPAPPKNAPVTLNSQTLFEVYSSGDLAARDRADLATLRLADVVRALPTNGDVSVPDVSVDSGGSDLVLKISGQPLVTITQADVSANGTSEAAVASSWSHAVQSALEQMLKERQPAYLKWAFEQAALLVVVGALIHLLVWIVSNRWLGKPGWPVQTLIWVGVIRLTLNLFPETRPLNNALWTGALHPLVLFLVVALAAAVLVRVWTTALHHFFPPLPEHLSAEDRTERTFSRRATLGDVARVTGVTVIWIVAFFIALTWSGVNMSALLASAGLFGVAFSLAFQDSLKDLVAGINILSDDRYGVGDIIAVGAYEGNVEKLTLRITQIRDMSGRLITLPNRNIAEVANMTARWAQVDFKVGVSYYDDLDKSMELLEATAKKFIEENPTQALDEPTLLGVDAFTDSSLTLRLLLRTPPGDQWKVAREMRVRVKRAFDEAGIAYMNSQYSVSTAAPKRETLEPAQPATISETPDLADK